MKQEYSAGAVVFRKQDDQILYLVLQYAGKHWDFPKGHIEEGEEELETVKRETEEETGIADLEIVDGFKTEIEYFFTSNNQKVKKTVYFYLAETQTSEVKLSHEHIDYTWLPFAEAIDKITFDNAKDILKKANEHLG